MSGTSIRSIRIWIYRVGLGIGFLLFGYQLWLALGAFRSHSFSEVRFDLLVLSFSLDLLAYFLIIVAWQLCMRSVASSISMTQAMEGYAISFLPRYIPGTIWGYVSRTEWMTRHNGVPSSRTWLASLLELSVQVVSSTTVAALLLRLWAPEFSWLIVLPPAMWLGAGVMLHRLKVRLSCPYDIKWRHWYVCGAVYFPFWLVHGLSTMCIVLAYQGQTDQGALLYTSVFSAAWLVGFVAVFLPSGLGVREMTLAFLLQQTAGIASSEASMIAVTSRLLLILSELLLLVFGITLYWLRAHSHKTSDVEIQSDLN